MSMLTTRREKVKKDEYIVTDYMYEGDNVGINLKTLCETKTGRTLSIPCIPMSYNQNSFSNTLSTIKVTSSLGVFDNNVNVAFCISYPDKVEVQNITLTDDEFATDMINTCILDKKDIKEINCYKQAFNDMVNIIKAEALTKDILIKTPEINAKCYIYTEDLVLLGTANRLLECNTRNGYVLGEYCGKNLNDYIDEYSDALKVVIDVCINKNITLQLTNVELLKVVGTTFGYISVDMTNAKVTRINNVYDSISYKITLDITLPEFKPGMNENVYYEKYMTGNSPIAIEKFYKANKVSTNPVIDVNKYLIW